MPRPPETYPPRRYRHRASVEFQLWVVPKTRSSSNLGAGLLLLSLVFKPHTLPPVARCTLGSGHQKPLDSSLSAPARTPQTTMTAPTKAQPWKAAWPPAGPQNTTTGNGVEYGVNKGEVAVVDGTAANVKPKAQPWKAAWPPAAQQEPAEGRVEYGVGKGEVAVVDGTAANVKPAKKDERSS